MAAAATSATLSLKPWARHRAEEPQLKDVLARVSLERGHFRDITEAALQEEVAGEGGLELSESDSERGGDEDEDEAKDGEGAGAAHGKPQTREDLYKAKYEMLQHVADAEQDVLFALDFVSLLMTKDKDGAALALTSISPALRQELPTGTLGLDIWQRMPEDRARQAQDEMIATNVRMEGLQKSADGLLAAANRLQDNVRRETLYWDEVLAIAEKGWNVCRIPGQQHRLGVTFAFSESAPEFSRRGIAALNMSADGNISLDRGVGAKPKAVRVLLKQKGEVLGSSRMPSLADDDEKTLEARIRHARDSLFDEELYQELVREGREHVSLGINLTGDGISFTPPQLDGSEGIEVLLELVSLNEMDAQSSFSGPQNSAAQAIALAARLLLMQAHRERLKKRSQVPKPMSDKREERRILPLLRPIMSYVLHRSAVDTANAYLDRVAQLLSKAQVEHTCQKATFMLLETEDISCAEDLVTKFVQPWQSEGKFQFSAKDHSVYEIKLRFETTLAEHFGTRFALVTPSGKGFEFTRNNEVQDAADAALASALAEALAAVVGEGWECNAREALLVKESEDVEDDSHVWISMKANAGVFALHGPGRNVRWRLEEESERMGLWEAFGKMMR
ncbi:hypothetical protein B0A50_07535 [Salinomyces thailandicus]|uniref:Mediator of RNA polymerase II transcription subunit 17 n=1 Tax=Salinomyces thailandicus TaxID=706561 RepID=A0A4U0TN48_9PEZI|nr:hypothetical protein B0A50_07535 [Salinomyces thailandica]